MLDRLTYEDFKDERGKTFVLEGAGGRVEMTLLDVRPSPHPGIPGHRRAFAILFAAPREPALEGRMYNIRHPGKGLIEGMFVSPVLPPAQDLKRLEHVRVYEAIFN